MTKNMSTIDRIVRVIAAVAALAVAIAVGLWWGHERPQGRRLGGLPPFVRQAGVVVAFLVLTRSRSFGLP